MADVEKQVSVSQRKSNISAINSSEMGKMTIIKIICTEHSKISFKKLKAFEKSTLEFLMAKGGLTAQADAAAFELLKEATLMCFQVLSDPRFSLFF